VFSLAENRIVKKSHSVKSSGAKMRNFVNFTEKLLMLEEQFNEQNHHLKTPISDTPNKNQVGTICIGFSSRFFYDDFAIFILHEYSSIIANVLKSL